jgi:hypothetical protein
MDTSKHNRASEGKISSADEAGEFTPSTSQPALVAPESTPNAPEIAGDETDESGNDWFAYLKTRNFYIVLALGYVEASGLECSKASINHLKNVARFLRLLSRPPTLSRRCLLAKGPQFRPFKPFSTTFY